MSYGTRLSLAELEETRRAVVAEISTEVVSVDVRDRAAVFVLLSRVVEDCPTCFGEGSTRSGRECARCGWIREIADREVVR